MTLNTDLLKHLFGTSVPDEVSDDHIHALMEKYPYFVHPRWLAAIKKWHLSHNQNDLQEVGVYTFNPFRLNQYCSEITPLVENNLVQPSSESAKAIIETSSQNGLDSTGNNITQEDIHSNPVIQPLFTQDYFAYTGAKLPDMVENDKKPTMEQLRSFTGWLRTMKRSAAYSPDPDLAAEKTTPDSGEDKYAEPEVVTETMAEVRASMGHYDKAIAIYEKLSLSNPEKSAYFAQKIEALKNK